jgi:hypothetical protein
MEKILR